MKLLNIHANAKLNLALSVLGKRSDGYHEIDTLFQAIDLFDRLQIEKADRLAVFCPGLDGKDNLAFRAAELFFKRSGLAGGASIRIDKQIPLAAGLGGGSTDAAAVLTGLNVLYDAGIPAGRLIEWAAELGADVPFFLLGGTARARGIGERLEPIVSPLSPSYLLFGEGQKPSTAEMYRRLDQCRFPQPEIDRVAEALRQGDLAAFCRTAGNSFSVLWECTETETRLAALGAQAVLLSGSGPTRFAVFGDPSSAKAAQECLRQSGVRTLLAHPAAQGAEIFPAVE